MNTTILLVTIIVFSFVASRLLKRYAPAYFAFSGAEYLAVGVVLGPLVTGFVSENALVHLEPIIDLLLGVMGFALGLMFAGERKNLKTLPQRFLAAAVAIGLPGAGIYAFLTMLPAIAMPHREALLVATVIGLVACVSSVSRLDAVARFLSADGWVTRNLRAFAVVNDITAVFCFGIVTDFLRAERADLQVEFAPNSVLTWLVASILIGIACGVLFHWFIGRIRSGPHLFLATVGCIIFASGMATGLGVSPLFVTMIVGATLASFGSYAQTLTPVIRRLEHPTLLLLLIFAGVIWRPVENPWLWAVVPVYLALRFLGLRLGTAVAVPMIPGHPKARRFGNGLLAQGGVAVAIAVDFSLHQSSSTASTLCLTTLLLAMLAQDFLSTRALRRVLADAEELYTDMQNPEAPQPEAADDHHDDHADHGHPSEA